jgi:hypothetical protein
VAQLLGYKLHKNLNCCNVLRADPRRSSPQDSCAAVGGGASNSQLYKQTPSNQLQDHARACVRVAWAAGRSDDQLLGTGGSPRRRGGVLAFAAAARGAAAGGCAQRAAAAAAGCGGVGVATTAPGSCGRGIYAAQMSDAHSSKHTLIRNLS